jgi:hypothetical protein
MEVTPLASTVVWSCGGSGTQAALREVGMTATATRRDLPCGNTVVGDDRAVV